MNAVTMPVRSILLTGLAMGLLGDLLLRAPSGPGVNVLLLFVALSASIWFVTSVANTRVDIEGIICIVLGVIFAIGLVWRGSPVLRGLSFLSAATAFSLPALQAGGRWLRGSEITDVLEAVGGSAIHSAFGTIRLFGDRKWEAADPRIASGPGRALAGKVLRGAFLAAPLIVVFGGLFMSADRVFSTIVTDVVRIDLDALISHLIGITAVAWLTAGYLGGFLTGTRIRVPGGSDTPGPALGIVEVATALALLDLLFLGFVVVQLRYLFGGATLVEVTPGLTYAEYARQGFFQLVAATALVLPWLLAADWLLRGETGRGRLIFAVLGATQLSLLLVIVASALERMRVYQAVYGLTELRFFVTAFLIWLTVVMLWFAATVLRGKRGPFCLRSTGLSVRLGRRAPRRESRCRNCPDQLAPCKRNSSRDPSRPCRIGRPHLDRRRLFGFAQQRCGSGAIARPRWAAVRSAMSCLTTAPPSVGSPPIGRLAELELVSHASTPRREAERAAPVGRPRRG